MTHLVVTILALVLLLPTIAQAQARSIPDGLRHTAASWELNVGSAAAFAHLAADDAYSQTLAREFDLLIPENEMKFEWIHPEAGLYDFAAADALVDFAEDNGMRVRGHVLVWNRQLPVWLLARQWTRAQAMNILRSHIHTVVGRYRGRVYAWDVVNEAIKDDGSYRSSFWLDTIGPDYIDLAFQWAHEADPDAVLLYNDFGGETLNRKADAVLALMADLTARGVPVHGVGLEMHTGLNWAPQKAELVAVMTRLAGLGLEVHITEMDVRTGHVDAPVAEKLAAQAEIYRSALAACIEAPACKSLSVWGVSDAHSWIYYTFGGRFPAEAPLILDPDYQAKPAYFALLHELQQMPPPKRHAGLLYLPLFWNQTANGEIIDH